jgi:hypothetical protein
MQFYARFQDEVVAEPALVADHVARGRERVSDSFRRIFDEAMVRAHDEVVAAPADTAAKVRFVAIYQVVLEATLGLTTFKFSTEFLEREGLLPGFVEGIRRFTVTRHGNRLWRLVPARDSGGSPGDGGCRAHCVSCCQRSRTRYARRAMVTLACWA